MTSTIKEGWTKGPLEVGDTDNVSLFRANQRLFEEIRLHNLSVTVRRIRGGDWGAPENQYRNAFDEARAALSKAGASYE